MTTNARTHWKRVSRRYPCPICGKPDWCTYCGRDDFPDAAICSRVESEKVVGTKGAGWLHRLRDDDQEWRDRPRQRRVRIDAATDCHIDLEGMHREFVAALGRHQLQLLALELGVTAESLDRLYVGWSIQHRAYSFPMSDCEGRVRGIRLRGTNGQKWSVRGGREGLFVPSGGIDDILVVCEGPTDTAALLDLGFYAIGRPSCTGGEQLLIDLACEWHPGSVAIIADADAPGQRGARYLAARLVGYVPAGIRIVTPPAKDAREWVRGGATEDDVVALIEAAPVMQLHYGVKGGSR